MHNTLARMIAKYGHLTTSKTSKGMIKYLKNNNISLAHYWNTPYQLIQKCKNEYAQKKNMGKIERLKRACANNAKIRKNTYARYKRALTLKTGFTGQQYDKCKGVLLEAKHIGYTNAKVNLPANHVIVLVDKSDAVYLDVSSRAIEFTITATYGSPERVKSPHETEWRNGKPCTKCRAQDDLYVRSFARIIDPKTIEYLIQLPNKKEEIHTCHIPENNGVCWNIDQNGLRMVSDSNPDIDYHMRYIDIVQYNYIKIEDQMRSFYHQRQEAQNKIDEQKQSLADRINDLPVDLFLCFRDSLQAGNCSAGTIAFCNSHAVQKDKHIPAKTMLKILNVRDSIDVLNRVSLVINTAIDRVKKELSQGFSDLKYHRI